jgi:hypothetical protein
VLAVARCYAAVSSGGRAFSRTLATVARRSERPTALAAVRSLYGGGSRADGGLFDFVGLSAGVQAAESVEGVREAFELLGALE